MSSAGPAGPEAERSSRSRLAIFAIALTQLMITVDGTVVNTAIARIQHGLNVHEIDLQWVVSAYTLPYGGLLLVGGRCGDLFGRRRVLCFGVLVFGLGSLAAAVAPNAPWFFVARGLQGVGSAFAAPSALALISTHGVGEISHRRAMGIYVSMSYAGAGIGLVGGGALTVLWGWRSVFLLNLPLVAAIIAAVRISVDETPRRLETVDAKGALTATLGLVALGYWFSAGSGWFEGWSLVWLATAVASLVTFALIESRVRNPLVDFAMFRAPGRPAIYFTFLAVSAAMSGWFLFTTLLMQDVFGYSPLQSGLAWLPVTAVIILGSRVTPRLLRRVPAARLVMCGLALIFVGIALMARLTAHSRYAIDVAPAIVVTAMGIGITFLPLTLDALRGIPEVAAGAASGALSAVQQIGSGVGVAALTVAITLASHHTHVTTDARSFVIGVRGAALFALLAFLAAAFAYARRRGIPAAEAIPTKP